MKAPLLVSAVLGAVCLLTPAMAQQERDKTAPGSTMRVTGCLMQGDKANEYTIKDANGKTYELMPESGVNLKAHVNHKVTITGTPMREKESVKAGSAEGEHLRVSNLAMVSTSCQ